MASFQPVSHEILLAQRGQRRTLYAVCAWLVMTIGASAYLTEKAKAYDSAAKHRRLEALLAAGGVTDVQRGAVRYLASESTQKLDEVLSHLEAGELTAVQTGELAAIRGSTENTYDFADFLGVKGVDLASVLVGMVVGLVFGFIDNAGLFFGMSSLDGVLKNVSIYITEALDLPLKAGGLELQTAGLGNTFSDALGTFLASFVGMLVLSCAGMTLGDVSMLSEFLGIVVGCLFGVYIPYAIWASSGSVQNALFWVVLVIAPVCVLLGVYFGYFRPKKREYEDELCLNKCPS